MKSALQAGVVAALLCPTSVIAGPPDHTGHKAPTCPKPPAYGSKRVTCILEVDQTRIRGEDRDHDKKGNKKNKKDEFDIIRTTNVYAWSFIWNYFIKDGCPRTEAHLRPILPMLGQTHHTINCRVEARWSPDIHAHGTGNYSVDYAGHGLVDWKSVPARMEWPFLAHSGRPEHSAHPPQQSQYLNIKYQLAEPIALSTFEVHSGEADHFSHCWGQQGEGIHLPYGGLQGNGGFQGEGGFQENGGNHFSHEYDSDSDDEKGDKGKGKDKKDKKDKDKKDKKHDEEGPRISLSRMHNQFGGHYNTKMMHSCWVFEKYHLGVRQVISEGKDKKKDDKKKDDKKKDDKKKGDKDKDEGRDNNRFSTYNWFDWFNNGNNGNFGNFGTGAGNRGNNGYSAGHVGTIGFNGNSGIGGNQLNHTPGGYPFFPHMWSTCEPEFMHPEPCHEHECHGDSCGSSHGSSEHDCHDESCRSERGGFQQGGLQRGGFEQGASQHGGFQQGGFQQGGSKQRGSEQGIAKQRGSKHGGSKKAGSKKAGSKQRGGSQQDGSKQRGSQQEDGLKQHGSQQGGYQPGVSPHGGSQHGGSQHGGSQQGGWQQGGHGQKQEVGNHCDGQPCDRENRHGCGEQSCSDNESDHESDHEGENHSDDGSDNECHGCGGDHGHDGSDDGSDNDCEHGCGGDGHGKEGRDGCNC